MNKKIQLIEEMLHSFHAIQNLIRAKTAQLSRQDGVTHAQWFVLAMIAHFGQRSIKDLAEAAEMSSSAATQLVDSLVKTGFVNRQDDPDNRRAVILELSSQGKQYLAETKERRLEEMAVLFEALTDSELREFVRLHKKITSSFLNRKADSND